MKKKVLIIFMAFIAGLLVAVNGCSKKSIVDVRIINIASKEYSKDPIDTKIIKGSEDLLSFIIESSDKFILSIDSSSFSGGTISFIQAAGRYDTEFFESRYLALCIRQGASSDKYTFKKAKILDDNLEIYIKNNSGNYSTCDVNFRIFIAEIPCDDNIKTINFIFV